MNRARDGYIADMFSDQRLDTRDHVDPFLFRLARRQISRLPSSRLRGPLCWVLLKGCRAAVKSWTGPHVFSTVFLEYNTNVISLKSWTATLKPRTNRATNFVHDLDALPHFWCNPRGSIGAKYVLIQVDEDVAPRH